MFVGHGTQKNSVLPCLKHCRITLKVKMGVLSVNRILSGGHKKKTRKFKTKHFSDLLRKFKLLVLLENLKNARRGDLILAKLKATSQ